MEDTEDIYNPEEPLVYDYAALNTLTDDIDDYLLKNNIKKIIINAFEIKKNYNKYPYIKYLLIKDELTDTLNFPELFVTNSNSNTINLITLSKIKIFNLLCQNNYTEFNGKVDFKGFYINKDSIHIFIDLSEYKVQLCDIYKSNEVWFCLIDEIINIKNTCNLLIETNVTNFFINNSEFCFLKNEKNMNFEVPTTAYIGIHESQLSFTYTFGNFKKDHSAILGPYYYFTDYKNAIREGGWSETGKPVIKNEKYITDNEYGRFKVGGIIRFALFLGKTKVVDNLLSDEIDKSDIKKERLLDPNLDCVTEELTLRISDHDGKWSEMYDSVYLGQIKLDNEEYLKNTPIFVLKDYEQQIPLSYHYIDKNYLKEKYHENDYYTIM